MQTNTGAEQRAGQLHQEQGKARQSGGFTRQRNQDLCYIALFVALTAVLSQISIPLPGGVPLTLQTFIIPLAGILIGAKRGTIAAIVYLLLGAVGAPVFANFSGGFGTILGPTGGFLLSFPLMAAAAGLGAKQGGQAALLCGLVLGAVINYAVGTLWFVLMTGNTVQAALVACVLPFIPTAIIKIILADLLGQRCKVLLQRAGALA